MIKTESGMHFIIDDLTYILENEEFYKKMSSKYQTKDVDFIIKKGEKILFIEAKTSSPKELDKYISGISLKFLDSLIIFISIILGRNESSIITKEMKDITHLKNKIQFVLIIKNTAKEHLRPIRDALNKKNRKITAMFSLENDVIVMNEEQAISKKFLKKI